MSGTENPEVFAGAVSEYQFERMQESPFVRVADYTGMGNMSEFDVFVSFQIEADEHEVQADTDRSGGDD